MIVELDSINIILLATIDLFTKKSKTTLQKQTNQTQDDREKRNETYLYPLIKTQSLLAFIKRKLRKPR